MALPRAFASVETAPLADRPVHLAIGIFDGVHLGHQAVIEAAVRAAHVCDGTAAVLTFSPHPSRLFRPQQPTRLIFGPREQAERLGDLGVTAVITHPFTLEFAAMPAEGFLPWLRRHLPTLAAVYVGHNWRFGARRAGDVPLLVAGGRAENISVFSAPPVNWDGEPVTSTRVRALLEAGNISQANQLLGRPYAASGVITAGRQLGRTIGFPTLNLPWEPELRPRYGVYRVRADGLRGVANYGVRPTVEATDRPLLEVHLLEAGAIPNTGDSITVEWLDFIRPEMKFSSLDQLKAQIARDVAAAG